MLREIKYWFLKYIRLLGSALLITALISCVSTTTVRVLDRNNSIDRNVKIYLDGSYEGKGEAIYSDMKVVGSSTAVTLKKRGCRSVQHSFFKVRTASCWSINRRFLFMAFVFMGYGVQPDSLL